MKAITAFLKITVICFIVCCSVSLHLIPAAANETEEIRPSELYARSAVLMDASTGRVLYAKNGTDPLPMASTTKIMTCILALENGDLNSEVPVSGEASSQPEVKLGMKTGQTFYLKDLLYSMMLESHNDSAAAIGEYIGGSLTEFSRLMNNKALEIGCKDTYFITSNGLDAQDGNKVHHTTAEDLALIMKYCIVDSEKKDTFLEITRTPSYTFTDCEGKASYSCMNHNAFLNMMEGALTGKTGFTADAGYCYVCALKRDERTFIVSLLACGWPNNKGYKWKDTETLMSYAVDNYDYEEIKPESESVSVEVENGYISGFPEYGPVQLKTEIKGNPVKVLVKKGENSESENTVPKRISAPVNEGEKLGEIIWRTEGSVTAVFPVFAGEEVKVRSFGLCLCRIRDMLLF